LAHILELLASNFGHQGRLREVAGAYQEVIELAGAAAEPGLGPTPPAPEGTALAPGASIAGIGYIGLAEVSLERNELDLAALQLERGFELCRQGGISYNLVSGYLTRAYLKKALGDNQAAVEAFRQAEGLFFSIHSPAYTVLLAAHQARLRLWEDGLDAIPDWEGPDRRISIFDLPGESLPISVREVWWVTLARLHLARGEADRVPALYDRVCATAEPGGRLARVIEVSMIHALALQALGAPQAAVAALERSLALGGPEGYVRLFIDEGEAIEDLLKVIRLKVEGGVLRTSVDHLLAALAAEKPGQDSLPGANKSIPTFKPSNLQPYSKHPPTLIEPLSERELEVLRLVGAGYSNGEIAAQLFLSLNTVKKHTSNIFGKLGVDSRTQAAAVARQLGLLGEG
jgi:LuxR family maltose regulon positive regulatory protein